MYKKSLPKWDNLKNFLTTQHKTQINIVKVKKRVSRDFTVIQTTRYWVGYAPVLQPILDGM